MKRTVIFLWILLVLLAGYRLFFHSPKIRNVIPQGQNIICFGDSLTSGIGATQGRDYPSQLARLLNRDIINAGIPGDTTASGLARLEKDVLARSPKIVVITLGGNDLLRGIAKEAAFANLQTIIEAIQDKGALVVVGGIKFPFLDKGFAKEYKKVCKATGAVFVPDILGGIIDKNHLMSDRIHPNGDGYGIMAEKFYGAVKKYIESNPTRDT